jgi:hypothetical protein
MHASHARPQGHQQQQQHHHHHQHQQERQPEEQQQLGRSASAQVHTSTLGSGVQAHAPAQQQQHHHHQPQVQVQIQGTLIPAASEHQVAGTSEGPDNNSSARAAQTLLTAGELPDAMEVIRGSSPDSLAGMSWPNSGGWVGQVEAWKRGSMAVPCILMLTSILYACNVKGMQVGCDMHQRPDVL